MKYVIKDETLTNIADAIREKAGTGDALTPEAMPQAIQDIKGGDLEPIVLSGDNVEYALSAKQVIKSILLQVPNLIRTDNLTNLRNILYHSDISTIPLNLADTSDCSNVFYYFEGGELPVINGKQITSINEMFHSSYYLRNIDMSKINIDVVQSTDFSGTNARSLFFNCYSLRDVSDFINFFKPKNLNQVFYDCYALDAVYNFPVSNKGFKNASDNNNNTTYAFYNNFRLKDFTFETNEDGTPKTAEWKTQTLSLTNSIGFTISYQSGFITSYNSGITGETRITDAESYERLKNHPDSWTTLREYSRYNHDSAVRTINSLPDTSAYLATAGGTNTISFSGANGSLTDGGAISTLTDEEKAVAAAKGWTVSIS